MRRIASLFGIGVALIAAQAPLRAQGTSGLEFLRVPLGARPVAMGEAYTAVAAGIEGILYNPAAAASVDGANVSFSMLQASDLFHQSLIGVGLPGPGESTLALSINHQRFEPIPMTDLEGEQVGQFAPQTMVLSGTFGYRWTDNLHTGATAKWYNSELVAGDVSFLGEDFSGSASGVAFDLGLTYRLGGANPLQFGLALLDIGADPTFNDESDRLPTRFRLGVAAHPIAALLGANALGPVDLLVASDGTVATGGSGEDRAASLGYGVELALAQIVYLRAGVPADYGADDGRPLRYGIGLSFQAFRFDFARRMTEHPVLGQETHLTMSLAF